MFHSWTLPMAVIGLLAVVAQAEQHRDAKMHFSFEIPDGWTKLAAETIGMVNAMGKGVFESGYQPADQLPGQFPFFVVQPTTQDLAGYSIEEIARGLAKANPIGKHNGAINLVVKGASVTNFEFEKTKKWVTVRIELKMVDGQKVRGISYGMIGKEAIVWLHGYAFEEDFERYLPIFNGVAKSFRFDEGHEFVQRRRQPATPATGFDNQLAAAVFLVVCAGVVVLVRKVRRRSAIDGQG